MIKIIALKIHEPMWKEEEKRLFHYLDENRLEKAFSYVHTIDQKTCVYSALIIRMIISQILRKKPESLSFKHDVYKKPILVKYENIDFSISHTNDFVFCGVSTEGKIGVDAEKMGECPYEVMEKVFHRYEIDEISRVKEKNIKRELFYKIWTRKEAYVKKNGTGLYDGINEIVTLFRDDCLSQIIGQKYMCSICATSVSKFEYDVLTEKEVIKYYLESETMDIHGHVI